jgi:hypothetical protein
VGVHAVRGWGWADWQKERKKERKKEKELKIKILSKLPGRDQLVLYKKNLVLTEQCKELIARTVTQTELTFKGSESIREFGFLILQYILLKRKIS